MMSIGMVTFHVLLVALVLVSIGSAKELIFTHVLFRHGDRTPYPGNTFGPPATNYWAQGHGELTTIGMQQAFELGRYFRLARYKDYLSTYYNNYEIYVRSDDYNRTHMTAAAMLNALYYPPLENQTFFNGTPWFPIPVHTTVHLDQDKVLNMDAVCPVATNMEIAEFQTPAAMKYVTDNQDFIDFLEKETSKKIKTLDDMWSISDGFYSQQTNNESHPLPAWVNDTVFNRAIKLYEAGLQFNYGTKPIQRLRGGPLLKEITYRMYVVKDGSLPKPTKFYGYSSHDTSIVAILSGLGAFNNLNPPFASAVIVELYKDKDDYLVELYYRNETDRDPHKLAIQGCSYPCKLDNFKARNIPYFTDDWTSECGLSDTSSGNDHIFKIATIVLACTTGIFLILSILLIMMLVRRGNAKDLIVS